MTSKPNNPFPGGLLVIGPNGQVVEAPAFFFDILEIKGRRAPSIYHLFDPDDPPYMSFSRVVRRSNGVVEYHVAVNGSLGGDKGFRYWSLPTVEGSKRGRACTFYITDESAVIQGFEWQRRRVRREILTDVQMTVSEFLNQKLSGIRALAEVLRDVPESAKQTGGRMIEALDDLRAAVAKMGKTSMVDMFGPADDQPRGVSHLADVMAAWSRRRVPVHCQIVQADPEAFVSASILEGILLPVVTNAMEASAQGDPVTIFIEQIAPDTIEFRVTDNGPGMPQRVRNRREDPFFTTKAGHLGLGLTHASEVLRRVDGEWSFDTSPGRGTTVTVRLPVIAGDEFLGGN